MKHHLTTQHLDELLAKENSISFDGFKFDNIDGDTWMTIEWMTADHQQHEISRSLTYQEKKQLILFLLKNM